MAGTVRIAGAGLAGLTAAAMLAKSGASVDVYEAKSRLLPSSGPHTEGIRNYRSVDALSELGSVGFDLKPFSAVLKTIRHSPHNRNILHGPAHYLFMRGRDASSVDQTLFRRAQQSGARFLFGKPLLPSEADIVATGPPKDRFNILGAGYTFSAEGSSLDRQTAYALFDNDVAPGGYLVITPGIGFHSIYSVSWTELRYDRLLSLTRSALGRPWVREVLGSSHWVGKIHGRAYYVRNPIETAARGGRIYVGEAGGFQDAVAGFGFRYAVLTGALAAHALLEGRDYGELLRSALGEEFEQAYAFRETLNRMSNYDFDQMIAALGEEITLNEYVRRRGPRGF